MREIAAKGRDGFYKGWAAEDILAKLLSFWRQHTQEDFDTAIADYVEPIKPVSEAMRSGMSTKWARCYCLAIIEYGTAFDNNDRTITAERIHVEIEAGKLAYRDRAKRQIHALQMPVSQMLAPDYAKSLYGQIDMDEVNNSRHQVACPPIAIQSMSC